jgi:hypothetical protein
MFFHGRLKLPRAKGFNSRPEGTETRGGGHDRRRSHVGCPITFSAFGLSIFGGLKAIFLLKYLHLAHVFQIFALDGEIRRIRVKAPRLYRQHTPESGVEKENRPTDHSKLVL